MLGEKTLYFLSLTFETSINIISVKINIIVARIKNKNITLVNEITSMLLTFKVCIKTFQTSAI